MNLAGARLENVVFEECEIGGFDARAANLISTSFVDCAIDELSIAGATLVAVDLSGARLRSLIGVESLRGAIISHDQLLISRRSLPHSWASRSGATNARRRTSDGVGAPAS